MAIDVYAPCPCGSGKKVKFCCHAIVEAMQDVHQLQRDGQTKLALRELEPLAAAHPDNPWILRTQAMLLFEENRLQEVEPVLERLKAVAPEDSLGLFLQAFLQLNQKGFDEAKPAVLKALEKLADEERSLAAALVQAIAQWFFMNRKLLAARRYLGLYFELNPSQETAQQLQQFDAERYIPFPFRGPHPLQQTAPEGSDRETFERALQLASKGIFESAAELFAELADREPANAAALQNAGLCFAFAGDEVRAAKMLSQAARQVSDFDTAVELETLAQLLAYNEPENLVERTAYLFNVHSVGRLLTSLDQQPRYTKVRIDPRYDQSSVTAIYLLLDREIDEKVPLTLESLPVPLASIGIFEGGDEESAAPRVVVDFLQDADEELLRQFIQVAGEAIDPEWTTRTKHGQPIDLSSLQGIDYFPPHATGAERSRLFREKWQRNVNEVWPSTPLRVLGGKTPLEAAGDESRKLPLAAALVVLETRCLQSDYTFDTAALRRRLKLPEPAPLKISQGDDVVALSLAQLRRLSLEDLTDGQLSYVTNYAMTADLPRLAYDALIEILARPSMTAEMPLSDLYHPLVGLCNELGMREEALAWVAKARALPQPDSTTEFQHRVAWDLREFTLRVEDPQDPQRIPLLRRLIQDYGAKVPELREHVLQIATAYGLSTAEVMSEIQTPAAAGTAGAGGLWTPSSGNPPASGGKIWLPGQE